jgi:ribosomal-protein-alanine N-acetyltransferase
MRDLRNDLGLYFLRTERPGFRSWRDSDHSLAIGLWGDAEVTRFIDGRARLSGEGVQQLLEEQISMEPEHGIQYWPVLLLEEGEHIGCCGIRPYDPAKRIYGLGVHIRSRYWRRGLAEEAASATIDYAFKRWAATALFAGHNPNNHASRRLLEKLGFQYTHRQHYPPTGLEHPSYILRRAPN